MNNKQTLVKKEKKKKGKKTQPVQSVLTKRIISTIENIEKSHELTAETVLEEAERKTSPLHHLFEWNDTIAARNFRLAQARVIINQVKVVIGEKTYSKYENIHVHVIDSQGNIRNKRVYKPIEEIIRSPELREQMIASSLRQLRYWEEENEKYKELKPIIDTAKNVRRRLSERWQQKAKKKQ